MTRYCNFFLNNKKCPKLGCQYFHRKAKRKNCFINQQSFPMTSLDEVLDFILDQKMEIKIPKNESWNKRVFPPITNFLNLLKNRSLVKDKKQKKKFLNSKSSQNLLSDYFNFDKRILKSNSVLVNNFDELEGNYSTVPDDESTYSISQLKYKKRKRKQFVVLKENHNKKYFNKSLNSKATDLDESKSNCKFKQIINPNG